MTHLTCDEARALLLADQRGQLPSETSSALRAHLQTCAACTAIDAEERVIDELLRSRLARPAAPEALKDRLRQQLESAHNAPPTSAPNAPAKPVRRRASPQLMAAAAALAACALVVGLWALPRERNEALVREVVNDHLRVLYATQPVEVESGGIHRVKPWFSGRVDFAPDISFSGDDEFPLRGGAVGYVIDRKAATFVFQRRLHTISLFVFRSDGLAWPADAHSQRVGTLDVQLRSAHGFHVALWQAQGLGHVLVSDASSEELLKLCQKLSE